MRSLKGVVTSSCTNNIFDGAILYDDKFRPVFQICSAPQQTVNTDGLRNSKLHRKGLGIKPTVCVASILPALCTLSHGCYVKCKRVSRTTLKICKPGVASSVASGGSPLTPPLRLQLLLLIAVAIVAIVAIVAMGQYTCDRCRRDKKPVKSFSPVNDMYLGMVPVQQGLTRAEEKLIAKGCPVMRVYGLTGR